MAYMSGQRGPLPHLKGEFYANWHPELPVVAQFEHEEVTPDWTKVRRGRPRPAGGRDSAQMAAEGWVGLYLIRDLPLSPHAVAVEAPQWMSEPPATE
jgi:hypothetical protein